TLRPSWCGSRGGCVSFCDLALWRLRLKWGLSVRGYRQLRLRECRWGSRLVSCRMYELGQVRDYDLHHTSQRLDLASEVEESLDRDDERSKVGRGYPYLNPLSSLLLTIPLHLTMPSVVLTARRAPAAEGCRPCPSYLC
ncbi:hypothetical protein GW17_00038948, partial [Ensete ventricosum]